MPQRLFDELQATRAWFNHVSSDDLDEVRAFIGQKDGPNTRVARGGEPMGYSIHQLKGLQTTVGASGSATPQVVRGNVTGAVFLLQVPTGSFYQAGRRRYGPTLPGSVVTAPPMWLYARTSPPGRLVGVEVQQRALLAELTARREETAGRLAQSLAVMQVRADEYERLLESVRCLILAMWPGTPPKALAMAEAAFINLAAGLALREAVGQRTGALSIERSRQREDWIEAHLNQPITMGRLCEVAGVGGRSLQKTFMHRRGIPPMRYALERRLAAVHHALIQRTRNAPDNVTRIALELGFTHLGRSANVYRQVTGELPSETLARWWA